MSLGGAGGGENYYPPPPPLLSSPAKRLYGLIFTAGVTNDKLKNGQGHQSNTIKSQVAENDNMKTCEMKTTRENGDVHLKNCNGTNLLDKNQTHVSTKNILGLDVEGVPHSLADDADGMEGVSSKNSENIRTKQTVNCNISKDCDINGSDGSSNEMRITGNGVTDNCSCDIVTGEKNIECTNYPSEQHNIANKDPSDSTSTCENIGRETGRSNDTKESSSVPNKNKLLDFDKPREKNNVLGETTEFKLSYNAKKHDCRPGAAGLANPANLCYINSVVQCLSSVVKLRTYLLCKYCLHSIF